MYDDLDLLIDWQDDPYLAYLAALEAPIGLPAYCCGAQPPAVPPGTPEQPPYVPPPYTPPPSTTPECPPGTQLVNGQCVPYFPPPPPPPPTQPQCPPGWVLNPFTGQCQAGIPTPQDPPTNVEPECPPGYTKNVLGQCVRRAVNIPPPTRPCPPGYSRTSAGDCVIRGFNPNFPGTPNRPQIPRPDLPSQCPPGWTYQQANDGSWVCLPTIY